MATTVTSVRCDSAQARKTKRPIRPNPLMATRTVIISLPNQRQDVFAQEATTIQRETGCCRSDRAGIALIHVRDGADRAENLAGSLRCGGGFPAFRIAGI